MLGRKLGTELCCLLREASVKGGPTRQFLFYGHKGLLEVLVPGAQSLEFVKVFEALLPAVLKLLVPLVDLLHQRRDGGREVDKGHVGQTRSFRDDSEGMEVSPQNLSRKLCLL